MIPLLHGDLSAAGGEVDAGADRAERGQVSEVGATARTQLKHPLAGDGADPSSPTMRISVC